MNMHELCMEGVAEGASAKASMHGYANDEQICMEGVAVDYCAPRS